MGLRFRKSIKIAPGVRLNVGTKSVGVSVGGKGLRYSVNSKTGSRVTASIPGTGISYTSSSSTRTRRTQAYRRQKELDMMKRQYEKMQQLQKAQYEVELYENHIEMIHSIHKECVDIIDWNYVESWIAPYQKGQMGPKESIAYHAAQNYKPSFFDKIFKRIEKKRENLSKKIYEGKLEDEAAYQSWEQTVNLAKRINNRDPEAYLQVIEEVNPFEDISSFGSGFEIHVNENSDMIVTEFDVNSPNIVPTKEKSLTQTGKLSIKEMTKTKFYDLYQDYVCSCVIRIARDLFAILPVNQVIIHAMDELLNTSTGHLERQTILSVRINRRQLDTINFENIDCSDALNNFEHHMKFVKTSGFKAVSQINMESMEIQR